MIGSQRRTGDSSSESDAYFITVANFLNHFLQKSFILTLDMGTRVKRIPGKRSSRKPSDPLAAIRSDDDIKKLLKERGTTDFKRGGPLKGETWADLIRDVMKEETVEGVKRKEMIARRIAELASYGVQWAVEFLADREEGKPISTQKFEGNAPVQINLTKFIKGKKS